MTWVGHSRRFLIRLRVRGDRGDRITFCADGEVTSAIERLAQRVLVTISRKELRLFQYVNATILLAKQVRMPLAGAISVHSAPISNYVRLSSLVAPINVNQRERGNAATPRRLSESRSG